MPHRRAGKWMWRNLAVVALVLGAVVNTVLFLQIRDVSNDTREVAKDTRELARDTRNLSLENQHRINDIQAARVESCRRTYEGVRQIFQPFTAKNPDRKSAAIFNARIDDLKSGCPIQTRVKETP